MTAICLALAWSCHAQEGKPDSVNARIVLPSSRAFVWSDSAMAARGPFATPPPPESGSPPDTIGGRLYWHGGVFVLPGTPDSVLTAHDFRDVIRKPGSVMHDYFEARWPVDLELNRLPLSVRQVRYTVHRFSYPPISDLSKHEHVILGRRYYRVQLLVVLNLPDAFFQAYGILRDPYPYYEPGWAIQYFCEWPKELPMHSAPREFICILVPELPRLE
ncbi:hypothetical protein KJ815_01135 [bacterium]|nr:hypothetical protein [bacterium]